MDVSTNPGLGVNSKVPALFYISLFYDSLLFIMYSFSSIKYLIKKHIHLLHSKARETSCADSTVTICKSQTHCHVALQATHIGR